MSKMPKKKIKVAVAMSGGVDSGVTAALLVKQGCQCAAFHMHLWSEKIDFPCNDRGIKNLSFENKCCSTESLEAARKTAHLLGIPFYTLDFQDIFKKRVVDYFLKEYAVGLTPNPCVMCNKFVKFGKLLNHVRKLGFDFLATGHYAKVISNQRLAIRKINNQLSIANYRLLQGVDKTKDQSYFLYNLTQKQLAHILFPVGEYTKKQVIAMAKKWRLPVVHRPESQEICFFPETDYRPFLRRQISEKIVPGEVVDTQGGVIGRHFGLPLYTIGQRHGFKINSKLKTQNSKLILPYYVIGKDVKMNRLIVGFGKETERKEFLVKDVNWINPEFKIENLKLKIFVRIRHQGELLSSKLKVQNSKLVEVVLDEPERGIAPGQAAVFYSPATNHQLPVTDYEVLGGGIIADYPLTEEFKND